MKQREVTQLGRDSRPLLVEFQDFGASFRNSWVEFKEAWKLDLSHGSLIDIFEAPKVLDEKIEIGTVRTEPGPTDDERYISVIQHGR